MPTLSSNLIDVHGNRIGDADLRRAMRLNIVAGALGMIWMQMSIGMPLTMFLEAAGANGRAIGALSTVRLLALLVQIPGAFLAERLNSRKKLWAPMAIIHRALWFVAALVAFCAKPNEPWLPLAAVGVVCLSDVIGNLAGSSWFSWMADLIPAKTSGRFWGTRQSIVTGVSLLGMAAAGQLLDLFRHGATGAVAMTGFGVVFTIAAIFGVADIVVHTAVKEPRPHPAARDTALLERILAPLRLRDFRLLTLAVAVWSFAAAAPAQFWMVYLKRDFAVSYSEVAAMAIAASLGAVVTGYFAGHLIDRWGARTYCGIMFLLAPLPGLAWFFVSDTALHLGPFSLSWSVLLVSIWSFLSGSIGSSVGLSQLRLIAAFAPAKGRTMAMAVHWALIGLVAAAAPLLGGLVMDYFSENQVALRIPSGLPFSFLHAILLAQACLVWGVAFPLIRTVPALRDDVPLGLALKGLVLVNPLQVIRSFYSVFAVTGQGGLRKAEPETAPNPPGPGEQRIAESFRESGG